MFPPYKITLSPYIFEVTTLILAMFLLMKKYIFDIE